MHSGAYSGSEVIVSDRIQLLERQSSEIQIVVAKLSILYVDINEDKPCSVYDSSSPQNGLAFCCQFSYCVVLVLGSSALYHVTYPNYVKAPECEQEVSISEAGWDQENDERDRMTGTQNISCDLLCPQNIKPFVKVFQEK